MTVRRILALMVLAAGMATAPAVAQNASSRWLALGVTTSVTSGHSMHEADSDALIGKTGSRPGIGFEVRGQLGPRFGVALTGDYVFKTGDGPLREGGRAQSEWDVFLNTHGAARVYVGGVVGAEYAAYDGLSGGQPFQGTRLGLGPLAGVLLRLGQRARLGVSAEYLLGTSPYTRTFKDGAGDPPNIATAGTLVIKARMLFMVQ